jgi:hypothetical protein
VIPVVYALMEKGAALGTVLAFMMSVVALSLPEMLILRKSAQIAIDCRLYRHCRGGDYFDRLSIQSDYPNLN